MQSIIKKTSSAPSKKKKKDKQESCCLRKSIINSYLKFNYLSVTEKEKMQNKKTRTIFSVD